MVAGPYYGGVSSPAIGEHAVHEALSQSQMMGQMGQQSIVAIQYLQSQL